MHLWSAASQQVDKSRVEGHDGVAHVNHFSRLLPRPETHKHTSRILQTARVRRQSGAVYSTSHLIQGNLWRKWVPEEQLCEE